MNDISKLLIYGLAYQTNKNAFESGMNLLNKQNKSPEEEAAAKSFKKVMNRVGITFGFAIFSVIVATLNFMFAITFFDGNSNYVWISMMILFPLIIISPILIVISVLMTRSAAGRE